MKYNTKRRQIHRTVDINGKVTEVYLDEANSKRSFSKLAQISRENDDTKGNTKEKIIYLDPDKRQNRLSKEHLHIIKNKIIHYVKANISTFVCLFCVMISLFAIWTFNTIHQFKEELKNNDVEIKNLNEIILQRDHSIDSLKKIQAEKNAQIQFYRDSLSKLIHPVSERVGWIRDYLSSSDLENAKKELSELKRLFPNSIEIKRTEELINSYEEQEEENEKYKVGRDNLAGQGNGYNPPIPRNLSNEPIRYRQFWGVFDMGRNLGYQHGYYDGEKNRFNASFNSNFPSNDEWIEQAYIQGYEIGYLEGYDDAGGYR